MATDSISGHRAFGLPPPGDAALAHSRELLDRILDEIRESGGEIGFDRYMQMALYAPGLGYYSAGAEKLGERGDFVTAPEVSPLFSACLAHQCGEVLRELGGGDILEFGGGSGTMASDMLNALGDTGSLPGAYAILEVSGDLRERQRRRVASRAAAHLERTHWQDSLPGPGFRGVVVANEMLDAMPVRCFRWGDRGVRERRVGIGDGQPVWRTGPADPALRSLVTNLSASLGNPWEPGYESELNPGLGPWFEALYHAVEAGVVLLIDYGYPRAEYYHPQRREGTLLCHYRHRAHDDPFFLPGLQDISANVDFTAVAEAAVAAGFAVQGFTTQAQFLLGAGITGFVERAGDDLERLHVAQQIKRLTLPGEMGDRFHVMALSKGVTRRLSGFSLRDFRNRL
jgi:SAM-dependent MidA family methyltransferase